MHGSLSTLEETNYSYVTTFGRCWSEIDDDDDDIHLEACTTRQSVSLSAFSMQLYFACSRAIRLLVVWKSWNFYNDNNSHTVSASPEEHNQEALQI